MMQHALLLDKLELLAAARPPPKLHLAGAGDCALQAQAPLVEPSDSLARACPARQRDADDAQRCRCLAPGSPAPRRKRSRLLGPCHPQHEAVPEGARNEAVAIALHGHSKAGATQRSAHVTAEPLQARLEMLLAEGNGDGAAPDLRALVRDGGLVQRRGRVELAEGTCAGHVSLQPVAPRVVAAGPRKLDGKKAWCAVRFRMRNQDRQGAERGVAL